MPGIPQLHAGAAAKVSVELCHSYKTCTGPIQWLPIHSTGNFCCHLQDGLQHRCRACRSCTLVRLVWHLHQRPMMLVRSACLSFRGQVSGLCTCCLVLLGMLGSAWQQGIHCTDHSCRCTDAVAASLLACVLVTARLLARSVHAECCAGATQHERPQGANAACCTACAQAPKNCCDVFGCARHACRPAPHVQQQLVRKPVHN